MTSELLPAHEDALLAELNRRLSKKLGRHIKKMSKQIEKALLRSAKRGEGMVYVPIKLHSRLSAAQKASVVAHVLEDLNSRGIACYPDVPQEVTADGKHDARLVIVWQKGFYEDLGTHL